VDLVYLDDPKTYVYDFTVPGNDSFMVDDNILVHNTLNTFHLAGVASKSNVTRGVPRLKELLKVTHNPKATSLTIALKPEYRNSKEKAREVTQDLELTLLRDMTVRVAIYFDPKDSNTVVEEDKELIAFYKQFEQVLEQEQTTLQILNPSNSTFSVSTSSCSKLVEDKRDVVRESLVRDGFHMALLRRLTEGT
jgi:DNA-directed RNA polymerase beta' subunit